MFAHMLARWFTIVPAAFVALGLGATAPAAADEAALNAAVQRFANQVINAHNTNRISG